MLTLVESELVTSSQPRSLVWLTSEKIYISYWILFGLSILGFCASMTLRYILPYALRVKRHFLGPKCGRIEDHESNTRSHSDRSPLERLIHALEDFLKAQCFFTMANNIAAIKIKTRGGLEPQSLQEIYLNYHFLTEVAISGYLPVTFVLLKISNGFLFSSLADRWSLLLQLLLC